ncbi:MAG: mercuric reductase [Opitutae bacterium]|nr:mercuric reductase [Opitutae bacterium]
MAKLEKLAEESAAIIAAAFALVVQAPVVVAVFDAVALADEEPAVSLRAELLEHAAERAAFDEVGFEPFEDRRNACDLRGGIELVEILAAEPGPEGVVGLSREILGGISPHDSARRFAELGVDVFFGAARFTGGNQVSVGDKLLRFSKAVIATGARASAPPIPGLRDVPYHTNETLFTLTKLPRRLAIIGAGPIGCEMAQSFARFGAEVFLVEAEHGILPREDRDAVEVVQAALQRDGVQLLCCGKDLKLSRAPGGVRLQVSSHGKDYDLVVDELLVAVGRAPNTEALGLDAVGVEYDRKGVKVDDHLRTTNPRIFACGDICSPFQFTHAADFMARIVIQNALFLGRARVSALTIPWATYTSPEIAHVGLYEKEAVTRGIAIDTFTQPLTQVDRAILDGESEGFVKVHVRQGTDEIVGATVVAAHAGDLVSELALAMKSRAGLRTVGATIHPYPTQAEAIRRTGDLYNRTRLTPIVRWLFARWLAMRR